MRPLFDNSDSNDDTAIDTLSAINDSGSLHDTNVSMDVDGGGSNLELCGADGGLGSSGGADRSNLGDGHDDDDDVKNNDGDSDSDPVLDDRDHLSCCGRSTNDNAMNVSSSINAYANYKQPAIFLGELPPRYDGDAADAAYHHHHYQQHQHQQQQQLPSHIDIGSCGSSIVTTDLHSLGGNNTGMHLDIDGGTAAGAPGVRRGALTMAGLRAPPERVTPGSQLDHSLATTAMNDNDNDGHSAARFYGAGGGGSSIAAASHANRAQHSRSSHNHSHCSRQHSYSEAEDESLAWRRALDDGPDRIRTSVEEEATAAAADAVSVAIGNAHARPPLGYGSTTTTGISTNARAYTGTSSAILRKGTASTCSPHNHALNGGASTASLPPPNASSFDDCTGATSSSLSAILSQNRTLQSRVAHDAQSMEEMAVAEAEAREELALLRVQYGARGGLGTLLPSLEELRGDILHRTRDELAAASGEVVHLRTQLEEIQGTAEASQAMLSVENIALREEVRKLSAQLAQQAVLGLEPSGVPATSAITDQNLAGRVTAAEATAAELRRQLEACKDKTEREADRAARAERERDALKEEVELAKERLAAARNEARDVRRDRDGLRGELTELLRARKNPERTMEKEFGAETDRLQRLADKAKDEAEKRAQELDRLELHRKKDLEKARHGEFKASKDAEKLRHALKALVDQLRSLQRAGELGNVEVNEILASSQDNLNNLSLHGILYGSSSNTSTSNNITSQSNSKRNIVSTLTQMDDAAPPAAEKKQKSTESVGINTTVTASVAANLYAEGLQTRSDLHCAELRISHLQLENSNLQGKCEHIEGLLSRYEEQKREVSVVSKSKAGEGEDEVRRLSSLCDDLKSKNARLEHNNASLIEAKAYIEDQNRDVVKRAVDIEQLADDAEAEIERLSNELKEAKARIERNENTEEEVKELEDDKYRMQAEWNQARRECELLQQELLDATERLEAFKTREEELNARVESISKSKIDYEWQCTNLREESAALNEKLEFHQSDADARDEKYNVVVMEKLDLEKEVKECRDEINDLSQARATVEEEASQLRKDIALVEAELEVCTQELCVVKSDFDSIIEEKVILEKKIINLEGQCEAHAKSSADADIERDRLCSENESMKSELTICQGKLCDLTNRLNNALGENRELQDQVAESEREWRGCLCPGVVVDSIARCQG